MYNIKFGLVIITFCLIISCSREEPAAFPDCGMIMLNKGDTESDPAWFLNAGIIRTIPEEMIREHMPGFTSYMDTYSTNSATT